MLNADGMNAPLTTEEMLCTKTVVLDGSDPEAKRREILAYFHKTFSLYESLFACLRNDEAFFTRANPLRHPLIFYYGHTAVFFINKLNVAGLLNERVDPTIESTLAIGVDEMSWDDLNEAHYNWPTPQEVKAYRDKTRQMVDTFIRQCDLSLPIGWNDPLWIVMMGIEHERIHLETSAVLIRELPLELVQPHPVWGRICQESGEAPENTLLPVKGGPISLGKSKEASLYGWDNEYGHHEADVADFDASQYLVSNKEYLAFVKANGYLQERFWDQEGWKWVQFRQARHPVYWMVEDDTYRLRTMLEVIDMPWSWPVEVNYLEAKAFCNWKSEVTGKSIRLPSEAEWGKLRELVEVDQPDWEKAPGNINLEHEMSPCPVNRHAFAGGFYDIIGNVWQWTETPIDAYEGFEVHPVYDDFSTPTFDGKHNIFKGGCWISTGNYAIRDSRYAFRRHFFQFSGLRYVEGEPLSIPSINTYETDSMVSLYIDFHYGKEHFGVPNFPLACARHCLELMAGRSTEKALDLGCATGRSSFELAKVFAHVDALDFSARLIQTPTNLQKKGLQRYTVQDEGDIVSFREVRLDAFEGYSESKDKIQFMQADACNLIEKFSGYDLVFAGNLLDRLYDPRKFLETIKTRILPGGLLVLTSPYTWLEEFTARDKWLGGFRDPHTGEYVTSLEGLRECLEPDFAMLGKPRDIPFVIRETRRKFQHTLSQMTVWEKKESR